MAKQGTHRAVEVLDPEAAANAQGPEMRAEEINEAFVPRPRAGIVGVEVDGEAVLLIEGTTRPHWLNPVATIVWKCFDGASSLAEIVSDLTAAFRADSEVVRNDVLGLTQEIGRAGLLEGVVPEPEPHSPPTPDGLEPGSELPPFEMSDLKGRTVSFEDLRGRRLILVNWSPSCGFCQQIAPELAELRSDLERNGVELVLLAYGSGAHNLQVLTESGLEATLLLQDDAPVQGFGWLGTPSAYLVDEEGKTLSRLTVGAIDVPKLIRSAAGREGGDPPAGG